MTWVKWRHPEKGAKWSKAKDFTSSGRDGRVFVGRGWDDRGVLKDAALHLRGEVRIRRHKTVMMYANPFDPAWDAHVEKLVRPCGGKNAVMFTKNR